MDERTIKYYSFVILVVFIIPIFIIWWFFKYGFISTIRLILVVLIIGLYGSGINEYTSKNNYSLASISSIPAIIFWITLFGGGFLLLIPYIWLLSYTSKTTLNSANSNNKNKIILKNLNKEM